MSIPAEVATRFSAAERFLRPRYQTKIGARTKAWLSAGGDHHEATARSRATSFAQSIMRFEAFSDHGAFAVVSVPVSDNGDKKYLVCHVTTGLIVRNRNGATVVSREQGQAVADAAEGVYGELWFDEGVVDRFDQHLVERLHVAFDDGVKVWEAQLHRRRAERVLTKWTAPQLMAYYRHADRHQPTLDGHAFTFGEIADRTPRLVSRSIVGLNDVMGTWLLLGAGSGVVLTRMRAQAYMASQASFLAQYIETYVHNRNDDPIDWGSPRLERNLDPDLIARLDAIEDEYAAYRREHFASGPIHPGLTAVALHPYSAGQHVTFTTKPTLLPITPSEAVASRDRVVVSGWLGPDYDNRLHTASIYGADIETTNGARLLTDVDITTAMQLPRRLQLDAQRSRADLSVEFIHAGSLHTGDLVGHYSGNHDVLSTTVNGKYVTIDTINHRTGKADQMITNVDSTLPAVMAARRPAEIIAELMRAAKSLQNSTRPNLTIVN